MKALLITLSVVTLLLIACESSSQSNQSDIDTDAPAPRPTWTPIAISTIAIPTPSTTASNIPEALPEIETYFEAMDFLNDFTDAKISYSETMDKQVLSGAPESRNEITKMLNERLTVVDEVLEQNILASTKIRKVIPPKQCRRAHTSVVESLQKSQLGFMKMKESTVLSLEGIDGSKQLEEANALILEADILNTELMYVLEDDGCY